jgi:hypothetical protein
MMIDYFNDCALVRTFGIAAQINITGELSLVFTDLWFSCIWMSSEKYKIILWKKKKFEEYLRFARLF